jgi:hypothetical protein
MRISFQIIGYVKGKISLWLSKVLEAFLNLKIKEWFILLIYIEPSDLFAFIRNMYSFKI